MIDTLNFDNCHRRLLTSDGFTLLEVMVSVALIAIVLVSIMRLQGQTILMNESSRFYSTAPFLAQAKMSEVLEDLSKAGNTSGDFGDDNPEYSFTIDIEPVSIDAIEGAKIELKRVDIIVEFNKGVMKYTLRQYVCADTGA